MPNADAGADATSADSAADAGFICPSVIGSWAQSAVYEELPENPGASSFTPDGLVAAVVNQNNGDGIELYERETLDKPFKRLQYVPAGYIDGKAGLTLSEDGKTLLGRGYGKKALAALKRSARGDNFVAQMDEAVVARYNEIYVPGFTDTVTATLLPDSSIVSRIRFTSDGGSTVERMAWTAADGSDISAKLPPNLAKFVGATTKGPQIAWVDTSGKSWISNTAIGQSYSAKPYVAAADFVLLDPCVGAAVVVETSENERHFSLFRPQAPAAPSVPQGEFL